MRASSSTASILLVLLVSLASTASAQQGATLLDLVRDEIGRMVDAPGASRSVAAGRVNPAAWAIQPHGGLYFG